MNSNAIATILAGLSLACVAIFYFKLEEVSDKVDSLSRKPKETVAVEAPKTDAYADIGDVHAGPAADARSDAEAAKAPSRKVTRKPKSIEERLARLEAAESKRTKRDRVRPHFRMPSYARNVDDLAKKLKLTPAQKDRVKSVVDRAKQQIQDVMKIPDAKGKSPEERRKEQRKKMMEAVKNRDTAGIMTFANPFAYRNQQIPGRNTTYGQEIDRIKKEARDEIGGTLSKEQKETFDETNVDAMLGGGGGYRTAVAFSAPADGDAVMIETAVDHVEATDEPAESDAADEEDDSESGGG